MPSALVVVGVAALGLTTACDKVPLLAPSGSTIALSAPVSILPANGTTQITATVISSGGQAVHNGTTITFTSNLGTFQPSADAQTLNGRATVTFAAGGESGVANITASSGAANVSLPPSSSTGSGTGTTGGTTTTPSSLTIKIGGAAVSTLSLNASPATVPSSGGKSTISATVLDSNGNALAGVPVTFTTDHGTLSSATDVSDSSGEAWTTLTTSVKTTVTASAGSLGTSGSTSSGSTTTSPSSVIVDVNAAPTVTITPPTTIPTVGQLATFTVVVTPASTGGSAISDVTLNFDSKDSASAQDLGALTTSSSGISVSHKYNTAGDYLVELSVTDASGQTVTTSVPVTVSGVLGVTLENTDTTDVHVGGQAHFKATVDGAGSNASYAWDFGDGKTATQTGANGNITQHIYSVASTYTVTVTVTAADGSTGTASTSIEIHP